MESYVHCWGTWRVLGFKQDDDQNPSADYSRFFRRKKENVRMKERKIETDTELVLYLSNQKGWQEILTSPWSELRTQKERNNVTRYSIRLSKELINLPS